MPPTPRCRARGVFAVVALMSLAAACGSDSTGSVQPGATPPDVTTSSIREPAVGSDPAERGETSSTTAVDVTDPTAPATSSAGPTTSPPLPPDGKRCLVTLHGKGAQGGPTEQRDGYVEVKPTGNAQGWGNRQWLYFPDSEYQVARQIVSAAIESEGCARVIIDGFSNGAAFAAKLYCRGETFGGRMIRYKIDDPVPDNGTANCAPAAGVDGVLYWTTGLASTATPGWNCADQDWTCEGGTTVGIDAYAAALGLPIKRSVHNGHQWYTDAPELFIWT